MHYQFSRDHIINRFINRYFLQESDRWILWWPVGMGCGIALYFSLSDEPPLWHGLACLTLCSVLLGFCLWGRGLWWACLSMSIGFTCAKVRTDWVDTYMLDRPLKNVDIEGVIQQVDYRRDHWRYVVGNIHPSPFKIPSKIRVNDLCANRVIVPGMRIRLKADLYPFPLPVSPQGFDFARQAYFQGIGAAGRIKFIYSTEMGGDWLGLTALRYKINRYFLTSLPPIPAALAMAFITGERGRIPEEIRRHFTDAGLAHLLAISGLHLGLVVGVLFLCVRYGLSLVPRLGERWLIKKISAALSIPCAAGYLALSGFGIPAQRAYLMITMVMMAIIIDRRALSMRLVALSASLILFFYPESLLSASFQLSYAAVVGLIAAYEYQYDQDLSLSIIGKIKRYLSGLVWTTGVASLSTLPLTLYTFNKITLVGIFGNLVAVPLMGAVIIPLLLLMIMSAPWGDIGWINNSVQFSLEILIGLAQWCSQLPGALIEISTPHPGFLCLTIFGGLWVCLWRQAWRYWGFGFCLLAPVFFLLRHPPLIYITLGGAAVVHPEVKKMEFHTRSLFLIDQWRRDWIHFAMEGKRNPILTYAHINVVLGKISRIEQYRVCLASKMIIATIPFQCKGIQNPPQIIDRDVLRHQGTIFIWQDGQVRGMRAICGDRPWVTKA